jgi:DNA-binding NarL/FixJ family response regulator
MTKRKHQASGVLPTGALAAGAAESSPVNVTVPDSIKVAIVEDEDGVRARLADMIRALPGCECVAAFPNAEEALAKLPGLAPQVVLMDINLPGIDGVECVRRLTLALPKVQVLMLTVYDDPNSIFNSLAAGASGYLLKPVREAELLAAVRDVFGGGAPLNGNIARKVVQSFKRATPSGSVTEVLSPRELDVLNHLAKGYCYKEVADMLQISYSTVRTHIEHIYTKLHVQSRGQAVARLLGA